MTNLVIEPMFDPKTCSDFTDSGADSIVFITIGSISSLFQSNAL